jgi:hypothetical protein
MSDNNKITNDERAAATAGGYSSDNYVSTEEISKTTITKRVIHRAILAFILFIFGLSIYYSSYPLGFYSISAGSVMTIIRYGAPLGLYLLFMA